jgi:hypothetical protein
LLDVLDGTLEPNVATAAASVDRTIASVGQVADIEQRLTALEARLECRIA